MQLVFDCVEGLPGVPLDPIGQAAVVVDVESHLDLKRDINSFLEKYGYYLQLIGQRNANGYLVENKGLVCDYNFLYGPGFDRGHHWESVYKMWMDAGVRRLDVYVLPDSPRR